jgi:GT2 family glycosyltransferase
MTPTSKPLRASVLTAVHGDRPCRALWLAALSSQMIPADEFEAIVVDASGEENCQLKSADFFAGMEPPGNMSYQCIAHGGRARALNHALNVAKSDLIIFLTDDFVVDPHFLAAHLRFHESHPECEAVAIGSALVPHELSTPLSTWLEESGRFFGVPFRAGMTEIPEDFFYIGNSSVKRELLDRAGRFNELFAHHAGDDFEFGRRLHAAGMKAWYLPEACAIHNHAVDLAERERASRELGENLRTMIAREGSHAWRVKAKTLSIVCRVRVGVARLRLATTGSERARAKWWQRRLDAAFAAGYRNGSDPERKF